MFFRLRMGDIDWVEITGKLPTVKDDEGKEARKVCTPCKYYLQGVQEILSLFWTLKPFPKVEGVQEKKYEISLSSEVLPIHVEVAPRDLGFSRDGKI